MTAARHVALSTLVVALAATGGLAARSAPHPDAPPPAHTGGFVFHLVGNAANDDASPFGDHVYAAARSLVVR